MKKRKAAKNGSRLGGEIAIAVKGKKGIGAKKQNL